MAVGYEQFDQSQSDQPQTTGLQTTYLEQRETVQPTFEEMVAGLPGNIQLTKTENSVRITEDWFRWKFLLPTVASLIACTFLGIAYWQIANGDPWAMVKTVESRNLFIALTVVILAVTYLCLALSFNSTYISGSLEGLRVSCGPLPWFHYLSLRTDQIDQLYVKEGEKTVRNPGIRLGGDDEEGFGSVTVQSDYRTVKFFYLVALLQNGDIEKISTNYNTAYPPRVMEHVLEQQMGINDRFVADEALG